jgi:AraC-like DNA-binding protein
MVDLEALGVPGVPVLGYTRSISYGWAVEEHAHVGCIEAGLCLRGALVLENQATRHSLMPGDLFVNRPNEKHRLHTLPKGGVHYWIHLRLQNRAPRFLGLTLSELQTLQKKFEALPCHVVADTTRVASAFHRMFKCYDMLTGAYRTFALRNTCMTLVFELCQLVGQKQDMAEQADLSAIISRIREYPERKIVLDDLAKEAALSQTGFINAFKQATGFPPLHYQLYCRLDQAKRLLSETEASITDIAAQTGFASSQHFATHFKKMFGCTPKAYRSSAPT